MPLFKLLGLKKLSKLRVKQLLDDHRILHAWYSSVKKGKKIYYKKLNRYLTPNDIVKLHALVVLKLKSLGYLKNISCKKLKNKHSRELCLKSLKIEAKLSKKIRIK